MPVAGTANTGGGGGGGVYSFPGNVSGGKVGAIGGSGIVIVRYAVPQASGFFSMF